MCCTTQTTVTAELTVVYLLVGDEELITAAPGLPLGVEPEHGRLPADVHLDDGAPGVVLPVGGGACQPGPHTRVLAVVDLQLGTGCQGAGRRGKEEDMV